MANSLGSRSLLRLPLPTRKGHKGLGFCPLTTSPTKKAQRLPLSLPTSTPPKRLQRSRLLSADHITTRKSRKGCYTPCRPPPPREKAARVSAFVCRPPPPPKRLQGSRLFPADLHHHRKGCKGLGFSLLTTSPHEKGAKVAAFSADLHTTEKAAKVSPFVC